MTCENELHLELRSDVEKFVGIGEGSPQPERLAYPREMVWRRQAHHVVVKCQHGGPTPSSQLRKGPPELLKLEVLQPAGNVGKYGTGPRVPAGTVQSDQPQRVAAQAAEYLPVRAEPARKGSPPRQIVVPGKYG